MEGLGLCSGLAHVSHHQQAWGRLVGQHVDGSTHRIGVGVVGVINEGHTLCGVRPPQATIDRLEGRQTTHDGLGRNPQRQRAGCGSQCIAHVVTTGDVEPDVDEGLTQARAEMLGTRITGRSHGQMRRASIRHRLRISLQRRLISHQAEVQHTVPLCQRLPDGCAGVIAREHCHPAGRQCIEHGAVLTSGGLGAIHELLVFTLGIEHQRHRRQSHGGQAGDLARMVHAHFDHAHAVRIAQAQQRERDTDVVVEVATRGKGSLCPQVRHQNGGDHFLGRGLAVAAGDGNQRALEATAPTARQHTQRPTGIGHPQRGHTNVLGERFGQHGGGTSIDGGVNESMAIEAVAA